MSTQHIQDASEPLYEQHWTDGPTTLRISAYVLPNGIRRYLTFERILPDGNVRIETMVLPGTMALELSGELEAMVHACQRIEDREGGVAA